MCVPVLERVLGTEGGLRPETSRCPPRPGESAAAADPGLASIHGIAVSG